MVRARFLAARQAGFYLVWQKRGSLFGAKIALYPLVIGENRMNIVATLRRDLTTGSPDFIGL